MRLGDIAGLVLSLALCAIFWFGMGIVTHLIIMPSPPDLSSLLTWAIIVSWPGVLIALALIVTLLLCCAAALVVLARIVLR